MMWKGEKRVKGKRWKKGSERMDDFPRWRGLGGGEWRNWELRIENERGLGQTVLTPSFYLRFKITAGALKIE